MTQLQKMEFDMLKAFVEVCQKLNLKYFLVCGSALGAVKYNGFIPWDDDIDVGLMRDDYEIFCQKAQELLPDGLFLQTYKTDPHYPNIYAKIRNSNTTYIEKAAAHIPMNHGIFLDVFPLDGYPSDKEGQLALEKKKRYYKRRIACAFPPAPGFKNKVKYRIKLLLGYRKNLQKTLEAYSRELSRYSVHTSAIICNHGNWQGKLEYAPREQYGNGVMVNFEGMDVRVPEKYDEYLTQKYGSWRDDLPKEQQIGHHFYEVCDLTRSYREYMV